MEKSLRYPNKSIQSWLSLLFVGLFSFGCADISGEQDVRTKQTSRVQNNAVADMALYGSENGVKSSQEGLDYPQDLSALSEDTGNEVTKTGPMCMEPRLDSAACNEALENSEEMFVSSEDADEPEECMECPAPPPVFSPPSPTEAPFWNAFFDGVRDAGSQGTQLSIRRTPLYRKLAGFITGSIAHRTVDQKSAWPLLALLIDEVYYSIPQASQNAIAGAIDSYIYNKPFNYQFLRGALGHFRIFSMANDNIYYQPNGFSRHDDGLLAWIRRLEDNRGASFTDLVMLYMVREGHLGTYNQRISYEQRAGITFRNKVAPSLAANNGVAIALTAIPSIADLGFDGNRPYDLFGYYYVQSPLLQTVVPLIPIAGPLFSVIDHSLNLAEGRGPTGQPIEVSEEIFSIGINVFCLATEAHFAASIGDAAARNIRQINLTRLTTAFRNAGGESIATRLRRLRTALGNSERATLAAAEDAQRLGAQLAEDLERARALGLQTIPSEEEIAAVLARRQTTPISQLTAEERLVLTYHQRTQLVRNCIPEPPQGEGWAGVRLRQNNHIGQASEEAIMGSHVTVRRRLSDLVDESGNLRPGVESGEYLYVVDESNQMWLIRSTEEYLGRAPNHSSLIPAYERARVAGELYLRNTNRVSMNLGSGHFMVPGPRQLFENRMGSTEFQRVSDLLSDTLNRSGLCLNDFTRGPGRPWR